MWPFLVFPLGLPGHLRNKLGIGIWLVAIMPGTGRKEPRSLNPVLELITDELLSLIDMEVYSAYADAPLSVKTAALHNVADFPANAKMFDTSGAAGIRACPTCVEKGIHIKALGKCIHLESRQWLDPENPLRRGSKRYPLLKDPKTGE